METKKKGQLILSRKLGESIILTLPDGRDVYITVVNRTRETVRLGFQADTDIKIWRAELLDKRQE